MKREVNRRAIKVLRYGLVGEASDLRGHAHPASMSLADLAPESMVRVATCCAKQKIVTLQKGLHLSLVAIDCIPIDTWVGWKLVFLRFRTVDYG